MLRCGWAALLAWAGADPFRPVPHSLDTPFPVDSEDYTTAAREAMWCRNPENSESATSQTHSRPGARSAPDRLLSP